MKRNSRVVVTLAKLLFGILLFPEIGGAAMRCESIFQQTSWGNIQRHVENSFASALKSERRGLFSRALVERFGFRLEYDSQGRLIEIRSRIPSVKEILARYNRKMDLLVRSRVISKSVTG